MFSSFLYHVSTFQSFDIPKFILACYSIKKNSWWDYTLTASVSSRKFEKSLVWREVKNMHKNVKKPIDNIAAFFILFDDFLWRKSYIYHFKKLLSDYELIFFLFFFFSFIEWMLFSWKKMLFPFVSWGLLRIYFSLS